MSFKPVDLQHTSPSDVGAFLHRLSRWYSVLMLLCALTLGGDVTWTWVALQSAQSTLLINQANEVAKTWQNLIFDYGSLARRFAQSTDSSADPTSRIRWRDVYGVVAIHTAPSELTLKSKPPSSVLPTFKPSPITSFKGLGFEQISSSTGLTSVPFLFDIPGASRGTVRVSVEVERKFLLARLRTAANKESGGWGLAKQTALYLTHSNGQVIFRSVTYDVAPPPLSLNTHSREAVGLSDLSGSFGTQAIGWARVALPSITQGRSEISDPPLLVSESDPLVVAVGLPRSALLHAYLYKQWPTVLGILAFALVLSAGYILLLRRLAVESVLIGNYRRDVLKYQHELQEATDIDRLTRLPNRKALIDDLAQLRTAATEVKPLHFAVGLLDLDDFRLLNETAGHATGDALLQRLAFVLSEKIGRNGRLFRVGGDEFAFLLKDPLALGDSAKFSRELLNTITHPIPLDSQVAAVTSACLGMAVCPDHDENGLSLLRKADLALSAAKASGKNTCRMFDPGMDLSARNRQSAFDLLGSALNQGWLRLHYQPVIAATGESRGSLVGVEALIRVEHPHRGLLGAISVASALDMPQFARPVGRWVLNEAVSQLRQWNQLGLRLRVMINISALHFLDPQWIDDLQQALYSQTGVTPQQIEIEITETSEINDLSMAVTTIRRCTELGVHIVLDDFGQGATTLRYLQTLPVQAVKIDQSFVRDMIDSPRDYAIVAGLVSTAQLMGLTTIAEGAENDVTLDILAALGCTLVQGFGIARPMSAEALTKWAGSSRPTPYGPLGDSLESPIQLVQRGRFARMRDAVRHEAAFPIMPNAPTDYRESHLGSWIVSQDDSTDAALTNRARRIEMHNTIHKLCIEARFAAEHGQEQSALDLIDHAEQISNALFSGGSLSATEPDGAAALEFQTDVLY